MRCERGMMKKKIFLAFCISCLIGVSSVARVEARPAFIQKISDKFAGRQANADDDAICNALTDLTSKLKSAKTAISSAISTLTVAENSSPSNISVLGATDVAIADVITLTSIISPMITKIRNSYATISGQQDKETVRAQTKTDNSRLSGSAQISAFFSLFCLYSSDVITSISNVFIVLQSGNFEECPQDVYQKIDRSVTPLMNQLSTTQLSMENHFEQSLHQWVNGFEYSDENTEGKIQRIAAEMDIILKYIVTALRLLNDAIRGQDVRQDAWNALQDLMNAVDRACNGMFDGAFPQNGMNDGNQYGNQPNDYRNGMNGNNSRYNQNQRYGNQYNDDYYDDPQDDYNNGMNGNNSRYNQNQRYGNQYNDDYYDGPQDDYTNGMNGNNSQYGSNQRFGNQNNRNAGMRNNAQQTNFGR